MHSKALYDRKTTSMVMFVLGSVTRQSERGGVGGAVAASGRPEVPGGILPCRIQRSELASVLPHHPHTPPIRRCWCFSRLVCAGEIRPPCTGHLHPPLVFAPPPMRAIAPVNKPTGKERCFEFGRKLWEEISYCEMACEWVASLLYSGSEICTLSSVACSGHTP